MNHQLAYAVLIETDLSSQDRFVFYILTLLSKNFQCFPKLATISAMTGMSERTVQRSISHLKKIGMIESVKRNSHNCIYTIAPKEKWPDAKSKNADQEGDMRHDRMSTQTRQNDYSDTSDCPIRYDNLTYLYYYYKYITKSITEEIATTDRKVTVITHDWEAPEELTAMCRDIRPDLNPEHLLTKFTAYYAERQCSFTEIAMKDTWLKWILSERQQPDRKTQPLVSQEDGQDWHAFLGQSLGTLESRTIDIHPETYLKNQS